MRPHRCRTCEREVRVEKYSEAHTSIQWVGGTADCPVINADDRRPGDPGRECTALRASIDRAVADGEITVSHIELPTGSSIPRLH